MKVFDVRTKSYRNRAEWEARQCVVFNLVRVQAANKVVALRVAEESLREHYYVTFAIDAVEAKGVNRC